MTLIDIDSYDTGPLIDGILADPTKYGLKDATSYGSGNNVAWCTFPMLFFS